MESKTTSPEQPSQFKPIRRKSLNPKSPRAKHGQIKGKLRKKNSMYFKTLDFDPNSTVDLRAKAKEAMETEQKQKPKKRVQKMNTVRKVMTIKKNSVVPGSLDYKLASYIDAAYGDFAALDAEAQQKEKAEQEAIYIKMMSDDAIAEKRKLYEEQEKKDLDTWYAKAEKELDDIEKKFGLDDASMEKYMASIKPESTPKPKPDAPKV